jgi:hypothetical protein
MWYRKLNLVYDHQIVLADLFQKAIVAVLLQGEVLFLLKLQRDPKLI